MTTLFILGSVFFWILTIITLVLMFNFIAEEETGYSSLTIAIYAALFFSLGNSEMFYNIINFIKNYPLASTAYVLLYAILGVLWAVWKFYFYLKTISYSSLHDLRKDSDRYSYKIVYWISYWPVSLIRDLAINPFSKISAFTYSICKGLFTRMIEIQLLKHTKPNN
jgi:hypothetical protein